MLYSFEEFLSAAKYLDYDDLVDMAKTECYQLNHRWVKVPRAEAEHLASQIKGFLSWMKSGKKPAIWNEADFAKLKPIFEKMKARKQLPLYSEKQ